MSRTKRLTTAPAILAFLKNQYPNVPDSESWWDVAVAEVSESDKVKGAPRIRAGA
jgi:TPP-dependent trihydroxycyclohexane-1,2-dione (THcHDO) dehydratase